MADANDPDLGGEQPQEGGEHDELEMTMMPQRPLPLLWRLCRENNIPALKQYLDKLVKIPKATDGEGGEEEAEEAPAADAEADGAEGGAGAAPAAASQTVTLQDILSSRDPSEPSINFLMWSTLNQQFGFIDKLLRGPGRTALGFSAEEAKLLTVYDRWKAERKRIEEESKKPPEEREQEPEEEEEEAAEDGAEDGQPKPKKKRDFAQKLADELQISVYKVREIGDVGVYIGGQITETKERHGRGACLFLHGDFYAGEYRNNRRDGKGTYAYADKKTGKVTAYYVGSWVDNEKHGKGRMVYPDGGVYTGGFEYGQKSGYGTYYYPNGDVYTGQWSNDKKDGQQGLYVFADGSSGKYAGEWNEGAFTKGLWLPRGGNAIFEGEFSATSGSRPQGKGKFKFAAAGLEATGKCSSSNGVGAWKCDTHVEDKDLNRQVIEQKQKVSDQYSKRPVIYFLTGATGSGAKSVFTLLKTKAGQNVVAIEASPAYAVGGNGALVWGTGPDGSNYKGIRCADVQCALDRNLDVVIFVDKADALADAIKLVQDQFASKTDIKLLHIRSTEDARRERIAAKLGEEAAADEEAIDNMLDSSDTLVTTAIYRANEVITINNDETMEELFDRVLLVIG